MSPDPTGGLPAICHFSTVHSGVEIRIVRKELASLAKAGFKAYLVIPGTAADVEECRRMGIEMTALGNPDDAHRLHRVTTLAYRAYREVLATGARIVHFHDPELIPVGLALKAAGRKVVMDSHEDLKNKILYKHWIRPGLRKAIAGLSRRAELFGARFFDGVVGAQLHHLEIFGQSARRLEIVRNFPLEHELFTDDVDIDWSLRTQVAYVGLISRERGIFELVQALPATGVRLQLAGRFSSQAEREAIVKEPGWAYVDDLGFVNRQGVRTALSKAFAGICTLHPTPGHLTSEPIKLFEYMAVGIPVICATVPIWQKIVDDSQCGICVDPTDPVAIADAITYLRDHPEEARRMGRNGREAAAKWYSWNSQAERLVSMYRSIAGVPST